MFEQNKKDGSKITKFIIFKAFFVINYKFMIWNYVFMVPVRKFEKYISPLNSKSQNSFLRNQREA